MAYKVIILYQLYMPSYFLGTFTEYPYFIPNSRKGLGIDSMGELAVSFELSGQFVNEAGISVPYIHIAHALEQAFNFTFGNVHKSKGRVFKRKPFNLTKALDYLKNLVIRENRNRVANKDEKR